MAMRIGLVGLTMARNFIDVLNAYDDVEVTAICDIDTGVLDEVGEKWGINARFTDCEAMLEADIDAVVLTTPIQVHGEQAIAALEAGKHVLCQYIAAMDEAEGRRLAAAARASGKVYMFIETDCYERNNRVMMDLVEAGAFGELITGRGYYMHDCRTLGYKEDGSLTWRGEMWKRGSGALITAVHTAMPLLRAFGERVESVYCYVSGATMHPEFSWHNRITTVAKLPSSRHIEFVSDVFSPQPIYCGYWLQGSNGCYTRDRGWIANADSPEWKSSVELAAAYDLGDISEDDINDDNVSHNSAYAAAIDEFLDAVRTRASVPQGIDEALHITAIGWAAEESVANGCEVKVRTL